jgi:hypothetical protein
VRANDNEPPDERGAEEPVCEPRPEHPEPSRDTLQRLNQHPLGEGRAG